MTTIVTTTVLTITLLLLLLLLPLRCCYHSTVQERFRDVIWHFPQVVRTAKLLIDVGKTLEIPTVVTEQYPKALGATVRLSTTSTILLVRFSCEMEGREEEG